MFNGKTRPLALADFLIEAQVLLTTAEECLSHLKLIHDDEDAINCMLGTLSKLERRAKALAITPVAGFCRALRALLKQANSLGTLRDKTVATLRDCFSLLAWQVELIDLKTGQLVLDDTEQVMLIATFAAQIGAPSGPPMANE
ncbi:MULTISPECIES: hypothetical protein [unclassified Pseudomonas]|uniref:hypothetical protein n=1 Tax=unclassified Pseudomonas TaxID=196821 RepID=UPI00075AC6F6|nr:MULTISPECIES: hypothetical protein [unclassified Pseudomonas]KVV06008.1 hypothetical protein AP060_01600 [Pseudomonas sp. TAD18]KVV07621.1 hypothetical protein AP059_01542 [Pseudomonas sp. TAA207]